MKKWLFYSVVCLLAIIFPLTLMAGEPLTSTKAALQKGDNENLQAYIKAVKVSPDSYEANWKCAKAHYDYANKAFQKGLDDWKNVCKKYGKDGMGYGSKAIKLEPQKVEGNLYYGLCVKSYADSVSVVTALAEGLKGSTQKAFETAYKIDKMYESGGPIKALGRFWAVLPWPLKDTKQSIKYFEEHQKYFPNDPEGLVWYAEVLIDKNKKGEAMSLLKKAAVSNDSYYSNRAKELMK